MMVLIFLWFKIFCYYNRQGYVEYNYIISLWPKSCNVLFQCGDTVSLLLVFLKKNVYIGSKNLWIVCLIVLISGTKLLSKLIRYVMRYLWEVIIVVLAVSIFLLCHGYISCNFSGFGVSYWKSHAYLWGR